MAIYKKNKNDRFTVRLTPEQVEFIDRMSDAWGCKRSDVIRIIVDSFRHGGKGNENQ